MLQYMLYFLIGGAVVTTVAYLGSRGNAFLASILASLPILFLLNVFLIYKAGGVDGSLNYAKGVIVMLPVFACYVALTVWLLPHWGMPRALLPGLPLYLMPVIAQRIRRRRYARIGHQQGRSGADA